MMLKSTKGKIDVFLCPEHNSSGGSYVQDPPSSGGRNHDSGIMDSPPLQDGNLTPPETSGRRRSSGNRPGSLPDVGSFLQAPQPATTFSRNSPGPTGRENFLQEEARHQEDFGFQEPSQQASSGFQDAFLESSQDFVSNGGFSKGHPQEGYSHQRSQFEGFIEMEPPRGPGNPYSQNLDATEGFDDLFDSPNMTSFGMTPSSQQSVTSSHSHDLFH